MGLYIGFSRIPKRYAEDKSSIEEIRHYVCKQFEVACSKAIEMYHNSDKNIVNVDGMVINLNELKEWVNEYNEDRWSVDYAIEKYSELNCLEYIDISVVSFIKLNFLFSFFEDLGKIEYNECNTCLVTMDDLDLLECRCKEVLKEKDIEVSINLLPTSEGFFFGSTEYNNEYYNNVQAVLDYIDDLRDVIDSGDSLSVTFDY